MAESAAFHLYQFEGGYYQAASKELAFELYNLHIGDDVAEADFCRSVPDDEKLEVCAEPGDQWDDPREYSIPVKPLEGCRGTMIEVIWALKLTARQWANAHGHREPGYVFGGDY